MQFSKSLHTNSFACVMVAEAGTDAYAVTTAASATSVKDVYKRQTSESAAYKL